MNTILDAALGVAVVFAVFALIVSGLNEAWASFLNKRGKQLFDALNQLMDKKAHELLTSALLTPLTRQPRTWPWAKEPLTESPAVQAPADQPPAEPVEPTAEETEARAKQTRKAAGAYIPSWLFAAAVMDKANVAVTTSTSVTTTPGSGSTAPAVTKTVTVPDNAGDLVGSPLGDVLKKLAQDVENDATQFEAALAKWYDGYMERVSGWYKRNARWVMFVIAVVVAFVGNVDAVSLTREVISDAPLRGALVQQASSISNCSGSDLDCAKQDLAAIPGTQLGLFWSTSCTSTTDTAPTETNGSTSCGDNNNGVRWLHQHGVADWQDALVKIVGLLIGALAISLGAPFWFDLIGRGVSLKGAGPTPAPATSGSSSDSSG